MESSSESLAQILTLVSTDSTEYSKTLGSSCMWAQQTRLPRLNTCISHCLSSAWTKLIPSASNTAHGSRKEQLLALHAHTSFAHTAKNVTTIEGGPSSVAAAIHPAYCDDDLSPIAVGPGTVTFVKQFKLDDTLALLWDKWFGVSELGMAWLYWGAASSI
jgi:hypothetical protein